MRSSLPHLLIAAFALFAGGFSGITSVRALAAQEEVDVRNALQILVTPSGVKNLESDVAVPFLKDIGWDPEQWDSRSSGLGEWSYQSTQALRLDELPAEFIRYRATFQDIVDDLEPWLRGFNPGNPLLNASLPGLWYEAHPRRLGVRNVSAGENGWIRAEFVAEFDWFQLGASRGTLRDGNNEWLGKVEFEEPEFRGRDLKLSIPFSCRLVPGTREFEIRLASVASNFDSIATQFTYKNLELPSIRLEIDGVVKGEFKIEEKFREKQDDLVGALKVFLQRYARLKLADDINPRLADAWKDILQIDLALAPPGAPDDGVIFPEEGFLYRFLPAGLEYSEQSRSLRLAWDLKLKDSFNPDRSDSSEFFRERGKPDFSELGRGDFDVGVALNPDLVTQAIDLSLKTRDFFAFSPIDPADSKSLLYKIGSAPRFVGVQQLGDGRVAWRVSLELALSKPGWYSRLFSGGEARLSVTALVLPVVISESELDFQVFGLDLENSGLVDNSIRTRLLKGLVKKYARKQLLLKHQEYSQKPFSIYPFKLAEKYLGISMILKSAVVDRSGHLLLSLDQGYLTSRGSSGGSHP